MMRVSMLETIHRWDVTTFQRIIASDLHGTLAKSARIISATGDGWFYPMAPIVMYLAGYPALAETFLYVAGAAFAIERTIYPIAKRSFKRRRPANIVPGYQSLIVAGDEFSFPSGHTSAAFLMASMLVLFFGPMFAGLYLWAAAVGASRVILGVHFPTDIVVGAVMGSGIAGLVYWLSLA